MATDIQGIKWFLRVQVPYWQFVKPITVRLEVCEEHRGNSLLMSVLWEGKDHAIIS